MFGHKKGKINVLLTDALVEIEGVESVMSEALEIENYSKEEFRTLVEHNLNRLKNASEKLSKISSIERKIVAIFDKEF